MCFVILTFSSFHQEIFLATSGAGYCSVPPGQCNRSQGGEGRTCAAGGRVLEAEVGEHAPSSLYQPQGDHTTTAMELEQKKDYKNEG